MQSCPMVSSKLNPLLAGQLSHDGDRAPYNKGCGSPRPWPPEQHYRFARGGLHLGSDDLSFAGRFQFLFAECACSPGELEGLPVLAVAVTTDHASNTLQVNFVAGRELDYGSFLVQWFPERNLAIVPTQEASDWCYLAESCNAQPVMAVRRNCLVVDRNYAWQAVVAQLAVNTVLLLQNDLWFFHASSVVIGDRGVMIVGEKGSGKTTLSLALAARSHAFLGDEYAAVCTKTGQLLPFRRAVSIRPGARAEKLEARLKSMNPAIDKSEDGLSRVRLSVRDIFPDSPMRTARFSHLLLLGGFADQPQMREISARELRMPELQPLLASLWARRGGALVMDFLRIMSGVRCYRAQAGGTPDETAALIERVVEAT
jgi:hypothetical protein